METAHEGSVTYLRFWSFWVRAGTPAEPATDRHFQGYESTAPEVSDLIAAVGAPTAWPRSIASAHHTENGAPTTASHVSVGVYLTGRWCHLDPTAV